ncbi:YhfC family glutamic-type intramembrane protease [Peptoniphilus sp. oral taxon 386]|uniref:YhfC family glutamic-type intramembrane protease n=1 Tax=Peptoniphilus sp. oral taxon 386 TaxID=652713 RepID=UPI0001DA9AC8|nr:YhfC family glutamic-type intramembrane protease [Peptoniphilus sp. oral taxon 386]EFI42018.1 Aph-1 protein [Peptoniphilus sp. oral taxon 386 str. F0131]
MNKKFFNYITIFICGMLNFFISQKLIRMPILTYLYSTFFFSVLLVEMPTLLNFVIAFSAGIFEETFRFLFKKFLIRNSKDIIEPIVFGLGHGIAEAVIIINSVLLYVNISQFSMLGIYERFLAIIFHICESVIIWNGFLYNKKYRYLLVAIVIHGLFDFLIYIGNVFNFELGTLYFIWSAIDIVLVGYVLKNRKYWRSL